jgi:propanol-preferring alcohol dehydrogenase
MRAMELRRPHERLELVERELPQPSGHDLLLKVSACGVCRTDLHVVDGEIAASCPIVPGHEIVGRVVRLGPDAEGFAVGERAGVPWLGWTCGECDYCRAGRENLCDRPLFTGCSRDGGYATHVLADSRYCLGIPENYSDVEAAPLLCAGLIGYRALKLAGEGKRLGFFGFGAAAHLIAQLARWQGREVFGFTRPGDLKAQDFARALGCSWAGGSDQPAPTELDAAIIFAPVGSLVPRALKALRKGGRVVCAGIHMSDIPSFPYRDLWEERSILSVANLTREDGRLFMELAARAPLRSETVVYRLEQANEALCALREGQINGAAVVVP